MGRVVSPLLARLARTRCRPRSDTEEATPKRTGAVELAHREPGRGDGEAGSDNQETPKKAVPRAPLGASASNRGRQTLDRTPTTLPRADHSHCDRVAVAVRPKTNASENLSNVMSRGLDGFCFAASGTPRTFGPVPICVRFKDGTVPQVSLVELVARLPLLGAGGEQPSWRNAAPCASGL